MDDRRKTAADRAFERLWASPEGRLKLARHCASFLRRYSYRSPYPPILVYEPKELSDIRRAWKALAGEKKRGPLGLYVHVPFCRTKCAFCNCMSVTDGRGSSHDLYLDCLDKEAALLRVPRSLRAETVCIGGGTPTLLSPERLRRLFAILDRRFNLRSCTEKMIEVSPFTVTPAMVRALGEWGVGRVTMGVQSTDPEVLTRTRRPQDRAGVLRAYERLKKDVRHVSVDLLAGLPGQSVASFREGLQEMIALRPDSISVYPFACIKTTPHMAAGGTYGGKDVARRERMLAIAGEALSSAYPGETPLERTADSRQRVDRDFNNGSVVGLGYSSRSYVRGRLCYVKEIDYKRYLAALRADRFPPALGWSLSARDGMRAYAVDRIEMAEHIPSDVFRRLYGTSLGKAFQDELSLARRFGLVRDVSDGVRVLRGSGNHERGPLVCGKLFYSKEVLLRVWRMVAEGRA